MAEANTAKKTLSEPATLTVGGKTLEFPIITGTEKPDVIDISKLYSESGYFTYDPGFLSTASCESKITFIDGDIGILRYSGYNIADLAEKSDFLEVCYLLLHGDLPNRDQKKAFNYKVTM